MPIKTQTERLLGKQIKEQKKQADQELKQKREQQRLAEAQSIVSNFRIVNDFKIMDDDIEELFSAIMKAYEDKPNEDGCVIFNIMELPNNIQFNMNIYLKVLKLYGMLAGEPAYLGTNVLVHISKSAKSYFTRKQEALEIKSSIQHESKKTRKQYDVFISHAAQDKMAYVDNLYTIIRKLGINIFYDTDSISWGDKWKEQILNGTRESEFAIIVISNNFFGREWTELELKEFLSQQNDSGQKIVLPLLHEITLEDLKEHYPEVGDIQCITTDKYNKEEITIQLAKELIKRLKA